MTGIRALIATLLLILLTFYGFAAPYVKSPGPVTEDGRKRCAAAETVRGYETRAAREYRAKKFREMKVLFNSVN